MGVGVVVRDSQGAGRAAMCTRVPFIVDPSIAAAVTAWQAAKFCCEHGFQRVIFLRQGDSLLVVSALRKAASCWSSYGQLIDDTKIRLHSLQFYEVRHTRRDANKVAHRLAKATLLNSLDYVLTEECLCYIQSIVFDEQDFSQ